MLEARVEQRLVDRVKAAGGMIIKMVPVVAGVPDRLVILPGGKVRFVELKSPTGRLRPAQRAWIAKAAKREIHAVVLSSTQQVDDWIDQEVMS